MKTNDYEKLLAVIIDNAKSILDENPKLGEPYGDEDKFHDILFGRVLTEIDECHEDLSVYEAREISEVCSEVEGDIIHGDILGL
jgi:hypothetical protein